MSNLRNIKLSEVEVEYQEMSGRVNIIKESALHRIDIISAQIAELEAEHRRLCNITDEISDWIGNHSITKTHQ